MSSKRRATREYTLHVDETGKTWYETCGRGGPFLVNHTQDSATFGREAFLVADSSGEPDQLPAAALDQTP